MKNLFRLSALAFFVGTGAAVAQVDNAIITAYFVDPTGKACAAGTGAIYATTGAIFTCQSGVYASAGGSGANANGYYLVNRATNAPTNGVNLGVLTTGLLKIAISGAVATPSTATAADLPATPVITPGTTPTLVGPRAYAVCTGTCTVTVPVPVAGYEFCVMNDDNVSTAITLSALGSSAMYENSARTAYGTAGTGTLVVAAAAANKVCIVGRDATHYLTVSYSGAVTVN